MAAETTASTGQMTAPNPVFASLGNTDWAKLWNDAPAKIYAAGWEKALGLAADGLQDQATYLRQVSQCTDPAEALKLNSAFAQQSVSRLWDDGAKIFDGFRASFASVTRAGILYVSRRGVSAPTGTIVNVMPT